MAKEMFEDRRLTGSLRIKLERDDHDCGKYWEADKKEVIDTIIRTVEKFSNDGWQMTLRQVYYQLVGMNAMPNDQLAYKKLSGLLDDCRYSGKVDWDDIEDRGRVPSTPYYEYSVEDAIRRTKRSYGLDRRKGQPVFVELWSEKDAISNILKKAVNKHTITVGINKGFASSTAIHAAYERFIDKIIENDQKVVVLYFGDHDPSGLDMIRDIRERLEYMMSRGDYARSFLRKWDDLEEAGKVDDSVLDLVYKHQDLLELYDIESTKQEQGKKNYNWHQYWVRAIVREFFEVRHIGLTMEQIKKYNLPPNPAKMTDPRAKGYIRLHGDISWEVDALKPEYIKDIIDEALEDVIDWDIRSQVIEQEKADKERLDKIIEGKELEPVYNFKGEEWGEWTCPHCEEVQSDPESIHTTCCGECDEPVILSDVVGGKRKAKKQED
jgi:hypothetical protein